MASLLKRLGTLLEMIKFAHTVFALPFALLAMVWAADGWPGWRVFGWILLAMVAARSAAMTFNRIADRRIDRMNPRTSRWPLATGEISLPFAWGFLLLMAGLFVFAAWRLNPLAFALSPVALLVLLGYSLSKRITFLCHLFLGLALAIAPPGAWIAVRGDLGTPPIWLAAAVLCWVAGFDILYALQDREFDRREGLHSIPARWGVRVSLFVSSGLHGMTVAFLIAAARSVGGGTFLYGGIAVAAVLLLVEHALVKPDDLSRLNAAFFTVNGWVGMLLLASGVLDRLWAG